MWHLQCIKFTLTVHGKPSIYQSIKANLYSAVSRVWIRGKLWRRLCIMLLVSNVKQFSFQRMPKVLSSSTSLQLSESEFHVVVVLTKKAFEDISINHWHSLYTIHVCVNDSWTHGPNPLTWSEVQHSFHAVLQSSDELANSYYDSSR